MFCQNCGGTLSPEMTFCPTCGTPVPSQSQSAMSQSYAPPEFSPTFIQPSAETTDAVPKPKKKIKKLPIIITAIVLALAIAAGSVAYVFTSNPLLKVMKAAKNTVFNSSEFEISYRIDYDDGDYQKAQIDIMLGDDIDSSSFDMHINKRYSYYSGHYEEYYDYYGDYYYSDWVEDSYPTVSNYNHNYSIKDGKVYDEDIVEGKVSHYLDDFDKNMSRHFSIDIDIEEKINEILQGNIDEKTFEKAFNEIVIPVIEENLKDATGENIDIPEYDNIFDTLVDLLKDKDVQDAIGIKKIKSDKPGTTYEFDIDLGKLADAAMEYALEDEQYKQYLEIAADEMNGNKSAEDVADMIVESFEDYADIEGTITIKSNRITNLTIELPYNEGDIEIEINSKK